MVLTQDHGKAFYPIDSWATMKNLTVPRVAREWLVGSYLMAKGNAAAINIPWPEDAAPRNLSVQLSWPEYAAPLGAATERPTKLSQTNAVWRRRFEHGVVYLHPRQDAVSVAVGQAYCSTRGEKLQSGPLKLGGWGAAILLDRCE